ncbi:response regulator [Leekyejoonella antrihumi]|uniref:Transcriptional regulatory protein n=1 Tax=Leekyejoonella antrihumi TaxID=1660198 RepID=A0A563E0L5_9MICO|nr:response regulator [Leekyejoonella antrihumi]TWP35741.1 response regulator [Leekyejoonella antrihumi]
MSTSPIRVVVVDDDYRVAGIHAAMVGRVPGFEMVGTAHTAQHALSLVRADRPQLVLMDIYLPDGSGLDVVRTLRGEPHAPDVMVISAARDVTAVRQAMQLGAVYYLVKPFGFTALAEQLMAYQRLQRHLAEINGEAAQTDVDTLFGALRPPSMPQARLAKGHSAPTLELVQGAVRASGSDISASEVASAVGISRATAQRYLNYLEQQGVVRLQLKYGSAGRPEHRYRLFDR